jgi:hypothetical protein
MPYEYEKSPLFLVLEAFGFSRFLLAWLKSVVLWEIRPLPALGQVGLDCPFGTLG